MYNSGEGGQEYQHTLWHSLQGLDSGFQGGEDDMYTVYDKPWRTGGGAADKIYRPSKNLDKDIYGDDVEKLIKTNKYVLWCWHTHLGVILQSPIYTSDSMYYCSQVHVMET